MSYITDQVTAEHCMTSTSGCTCGAMRLGGSYTRHVAIVTEAATRAQVAADINEAAAGIAYHESGDEDLVKGMFDAALIAEGTDR